MPQYPDWVNKFREPGTSVKKVGNAYYLYKTTSVRISGMKNPQPKSEYIGVITSDGVNRSSVKKLATDRVRVYEYGFSYTLQALTPPKFMQDIGDAETARMYLLNLIKHYSLHSYLLRGVALPSAQEIHMSLPRQARKLERLCGITLESLFPLKELYLVEMNGHDLISEVTPEISSLMARVGVRL